MHAYGYTSLIPRPLPFFQCYWGQGYAWAKFSKLLHNHNTSEAIIVVNDTLEQSEYDGYRLQVLPFLSSPIELFSIQAELTVGHGSVCALAFFDKDMNLFLVSAPIR